MILNGMVTNSHILGDVTRCHMPVSLDVFHDLISIQSQATAGWLIHGVVFSGSESSKPFLCGSK